MLKRKQRESRRIIYLFLSLFLCLSVHSFVHPFIYPFIHPSSQPLSQFKIPEYLNLKQKQSQRKKNYTNPVYPTVHSLLQVFNNVNDTWEHDCEHVWPDQTLSIDFRLSICLAWRHAHMQWPWLRIQLNFKPRFKNAINYLSTVISLPTSIFKTSFLKPNPPPLDQRRKSSAFFRWHVKPLLKKI